MEKFGLNQLREMFLSFFETKGHLRLPSFSLIPQNDASLLLINSGMAPMKPYFKGEQEPPRHRVCTCQKCIRTGDIENIGKTARHGTYFEMLGNFSFGDYFKKEAIAWSWEFLTSPQWVGIDPERLYPSIYLEDDEAFEIWNKDIGIPAERIFRFGKEDNFWEHGAGPCGPCSEIYFDRGEQYGCGKPDCTVGCDCDRYMEVWNNVFSQFDNDGEGHYTELKQKNIDTGMGLERLAVVCQGVDSLFDVDTVIGAEFSRDPMPNFHELLEKCPTGELYVPTIGGGTANVEFEVMSGMNMDFFGAGETPYNTIIQEVTCETIANTLRSHGYYSTALHNNTGTFFSRNEDYAQLGYDRFDPLEYMLYPEYNKVGWCHDTVLTDEILRVMENSEQRDLIFAISVESHGKYADTYEYTDGDIEILSLPEDAYLAPFQNYINVIPAVDAFVGELLDAFSSYDEPVLVVLYGDHLPALGLTAEMLTTGDLYASRYVIWNNYGAEFEARDMQAYRLSAELLRQLGVSDGVMTKFHQSYPLDAEDEEYIEKLKTLEYDLLYGEQEAYGEQGPYAPTDLKLGVDPIVITGVELEYGRLLVSGDNFTEYSAVVSGENVLETVFIDKEHLAVRITADERALLGETICVAQINPDGKELGRTEEFVLD